MIDAFYSLMGQFNNTYFNIIVFSVCSLIVLYVFTSLLNILMSFFKN